MLGAMAPLTNRSIDDPNAAPVRAEMPDDGLRMQMLFSRQFSPEAVHFTPIPLRFDDVVKGNQSTRSNQGEVHLVITPDTAVRVVSINKQ